MAKQDLYKTAQQSAKLFKLINENQDLEPWVREKITKAADNITTVYQYLNYEKQFQDYSKVLAESTNLSESKRTLLAEKLSEAKDKVKELKKKAAKEKAEKMDEDRTETTKTQHGTATATYGDDGKRKGVVHKDERKYSDEEHGEVASTAKAKSAAEKKADKEKEIKLPKPSKGTRVWGMKGGEKFEKTVKEAAAKKKPVKNLPGNQEKIDVAEPKGKIDGKDMAALRAKKNEGTYLGKAMAEGKKCPICKKDPCGCGKSKKVAAKKVVKEADLGKHNNATTGFKALAKKAGKQYGNSATGEKVAGAVLKKMRTDGKIKEAVARAKEMLEGKGKKDKMDMEGNAFGKAVRDAKKDGIQKGEKVKVGGKDIPLKESTEFDRLKTLMTRLNG